MPEFEVGSFYRFSLEARDYMRTGLGGSLVDTIKNNLVEVRAINLSSIDFKFLNEDFTPAGAGTVVRTANIQPGWFTEA